MGKEKQSAWETESGLIDDVDAWIANPHFGFKEEYAQAVLQTSGEGGGAMFIIDLEDDEGNTIGSQGWSIGTGWEISEDNLSISHAKRKNVVHSSMYGQLINIVTKELGVDMDDYGMPTEAMSWDGLGFHWMLKPHTTVSGKEVMGLMPTQSLGKKGGESVPAPKKAAPAKVSSAEQEALKLVAGSSTAKEFQMKAMRVPAIVNDDKLMARCLDDGPEGFFATNKK